MLYVLLAHVVLINWQGDQREGWKKEEHRDGGIREGEIGERGCKGIILCLSPF
jgi:hypothetical protein